MESTFAVVVGSIFSMGGQGRLKPSAGHLRVASMPILLPKLGRREAWSRESMGPRVNWMSRSGSMLLASAEGDFGQVLDVAVLVYDDDALGEHRLAHGPDAVHDFAGVAGVGFADADDHQVVEDGLGGRHTSTISGRVSCMRGRKMRSTALPIQASSMGGLPTMVAA